MRKNIEALITSGIPAHRVAKASGIPNNTVVRLFSGESSLDNIRFSLAEKLNEYWEALRMVEVCGVKIEVTKLAEYMHDELREELQGEITEDQSYIDTYIERARTEDVGFIDVLASEFGIHV